MYESWLVQMCDTAHWKVFRCINVSHMWDMTPSDIWLSRTYATWRDECVAVCVLLQTYETWLIHVIIHSFHDSFMRHDSCSHTKQHKTRRGVTQRNEIFEINPPVTIWDVTHLHIRDMTQSDIWDKTRSDVWHRAWIFFRCTPLSHTCETWLIHIYETDETLRHMRPDSVGQMSHDSFRHVRHDSFRCVTPHIEKVVGAPTCDMTDSLCDMKLSHAWHVWHDSFVYLTGCIHMWDMTHYSWNFQMHTPVAWPIQMRDRTHSYVWRDTFRCVTRVTKVVGVSDMTRSYMGHDSFLCANNTSNMIRSHVRYESSFCANDRSDMTRSCEGHDSFFCENYWSNMTRSECGRWFILAFTRETHSFVNTIKQTKLAHRVGNDAFVVSGRWIWKTYESFISGSWHV